jgi:hypothetical protein
VCVLCVLCVCVCVCVFVMWAVMCYRGANAVSGARARACVCVCVCVCVLCVRVCAASRDSESSLCTASQRSILIHRYSLTRRSISLTCLTRCDYWSNSVLRLLLTELGLSQPRCGLLSSASRKHLGHQNYTLLGARSSCVPLLHTCE